MLGIHGEFSHYRSKGSLLVPLRLASVDAIPTKSDIGLGMNDVCGEEEEKRKERM